MRSTNYNIPTGYIPVTQAYTSGLFFSDEVTIVRDTAVGRAIQRFYVWLDTFLKWSAEYDGDTLGLTGGERFPWWSMTYWACQPMRFANKWFLRASRRF